VTARSLSVRGRGNGLGHLRDGASGEIGTAALQAVVKLPREQIRYYLRALRKEGRIEPTHSLSNAKTQTYRLISAPKP
jgi:predicted transcriptional regulator